MGLRLAVLTNGEQVQQEDKLRRMGILDEFDAVLAASELPAFKPSRLAFDALCAALNQLASSVVYVGDDLAVDAIGARAAGLTSVWIDRHGRGGEPAGVPAIVSLTELPGHIRGGPPVHPLPLFRARPLSPLRAEGWQTRSVRETALLIEVPEAEPLVGPWRERYDPVTARGIPAHITALWPFVPPPDLDAAVIERLRMVLAHVKPFAFRLADIDESPGVLWLRPEPDDPNKAPTRALWRAFPAFPP